MTANTAEEVRRFPRESRGILTFLGSANLETRMSALRITRLKVFDGPPRHAASEMKPEDASHPEWEPGARGPSGLGCALGSVPDP